MDTQITAKKLLLVEGKDEINFFSALFKEVDIDDVQVFESKGKDKFDGELELILNDPNFEHVISIGVVRDADLNHDSAFKSVCSSLKKFNLPTPKGHLLFAKNERIQTGVFIAPGFTSNGMLESLILESLADHPVKIASAEYINTLRASLAPTNEQCIYKFPRNEHKAHMHAFLAGMEKFLPSVGMAAVKGYFNLSSHVFDDIKDFIKKI